MKTERYKYEDMIKFGRDVLVKIGFSEADALITSKILVEADLRDIHSHGIAGGSSLGDIVDKKEKGGIVIEEPIVLKPQKYSAIFNINANGGLGHVATDLACDLVIERAKEIGYAKAFIFNSSHFGIAGYYSEKIAKQDLAGRVSCTSPIWTRPFIESGVYKGVQKRLGTNPIAWSIPYEGGILTLDIATTQRAVSPAIKIAEDNYAKLLRLKEKTGIDYISNIDKIQGRVAIGQGKYQEIQEQLRKNLETRLEELPRQYILDQNGKEVKFPLRFNNYFKQNFWIAPLGGTVFGYKGFILNLLVEMDNIIGGGNPNPIPSGDQTPAGRVSQTVEAYCIDSLRPLEQVKKDLKYAVEVTIVAGGSCMKLPGQKEHEHTSERIVKGIPYSVEQIDKLVEIEKKAGVTFEAKPIIS